MQPAVAVTKDYKIYIYLDERQHGKSMRVEPCELMGFNFGEFVMKPQADALAGLFLTQC